MIRKPTEEDIKAIADLHALILPDSIFVQLGRHFLECYYHDMLIRKKHVFSYVYEHNERIVGFIAMAASQRLFYAEIKKDFVPLTLALFRAVIGSPRSILQIIKAIGFVTRKDRLIQSDAEGELLQIAVHPEYRLKQNEDEYTSFFKTNRIKVAEELFRTAMADLRNRNIKDFRIMTGDSNTTSNKFYIKMGCKKVASGIRVFGNPTSLYIGNAKGV